MKNADYDFEVKFDGCGYRFDVFVNTNEDPNEVAKRIQKAARGQVKAACVVMAAKLTPEEVKTFMKLAAESVAAGLGTAYKIDG